MKLNEIGLQRKYGYPKYPASSIEDLSILFNKEKQILQFLEQMPSLRNNSIFVRHIQELKDQIDYNV